jgi:transposase
MRKSLKNKRDDFAFECVKEFIEGLVKGFFKKKIDIAFFDESGFSLTPSIPYRWQEKGKTAAINCERSKTINTLGFLSPDCKLTAYTVNGTVNSNVVIKCFEEYFEQTKGDKPMIVIADNAPTHKSKGFMEKVELWAKKDCYLFFLPPYSPELNIIEILWRFIKYEWLEVCAYQNFEKLEEALCKVLDAVGTKHLINFFSNIKKLLDEYLC